MMNPLSDQELDLVYSLLAQGRITKANELLGKPYQIQGTVVHGNHLGNKLGFPTANLEIPKGTPLYIAIGVYAVFVSFPGNWLTGMVNIGTRPTIDGKNLRIEVNLFGFDGDLYGKTLTLHFIDRIRDEIKFNSLDDLIVQIQHDKEVAKKLLSGRDKPNSKT